MRKKLTSEALLFTTILLTACGSGDDSSSDNSYPTWTQGVFASESNFKNRCENPRIGADIKGDAYEDVAGSKLYEKHWLRSWSNNTYLWYDEIIDSDISVVDTPYEYFNTLRTTAVTHSGQAKDRFHFAQNTAEYEQLVSAGAALSYGAEFRYLKSVPPRELRVVYIEPNSPAASAGLSRGTEILAIDGVDLVESNDMSTLENGLNPKIAGESHTFVVRDLGQTMSRSVVLQAAVVTKQPVKSTRIIDTPSGKIGYFALTTFAMESAEAALVEAMTDLSAEALDDLVIDLRYNWGGYLAISSQLGYMIAGSAMSSGNVFEKTVFNNKHPTLNPATGGVISHVPFYETTIGYSVEVAQPLPSLNLSRVFILSSSNTCSASESLINAMRGIDVDVVLIGGTTCGKPYGFYSTDNCGITYSTIQFRGENAKGFGDYADGFSPDNATGLVGERIEGCQVAEDILHPLGDEQEVMLKAALDYRNTGTCPAVIAGRPVAMDVIGDIRNDPRYIERQLKEQIRLDKLRIIKH